MDTQWPGDVASLIAEMKRLAGLSTDQELARLIGAAQSTVANWRKRGAVPEKAILTFERAVAFGSQFTRTVAAGAVALRVSEELLSRFGGGKKETARFVAYTTVSSHFNSIVSEVMKSLVMYERKFGGSTFKAAERFMNDDEFIAGIADWLDAQSMAEALVREARALANTAR